MPAYAQGGWHAPAEGNGSHEYKAPINRGETRDFTNPERCSAALQTILFTKQWDSEICCVHKSSIGFTHETFR